MKIAFLSLGIATALFCGCASTVRQARHVTPGMTSAEVEKLMGKPYMITTSGFDDIWIYQCGAWTLDTKTVSLVFRNGKVTEAPQTLPAKD